MSNSRDPSAQPEKQGSAPSRFNATQYGSLQVPATDAPAVAADHIAHPSSFSSLISYFASVSNTGKLGNTPPDPPSLGTFRLLVTIFPFQSLLLQFVYSFVITVLSEPPFSLRLFLPTSILSAVGWALFILSAFFVSEASSRYRDALTAWNEFSALLPLIVCPLTQLYPADTWHHGDLKRIVAFLCAYPVALKMHLRGEKDASVLRRLLDERDVQDVLSAPQGMHVYCMQVVRGYISAAEDDAFGGFRPALDTTPAGPAARFVIMQTTDSVDVAANRLSRILRFAPAKGYVNHLRIFLGVWLMLLPFCILSASGWYTPLFSVLITYAVSMPFLIACALNEPFGYDSQDIQLNRLAAEASCSVLQTYDSDRLRLPDVVRERPASAQLFSGYFRDRYTSTNTLHRGATPSNRFQYALSGLLKPSVAFPLVVFIVWIAAIIGFSLNGAELKNTFLLTVLGGWGVHVPLNLATVSLLGLGVFTLLGFWMNDAYGRYRRGLEIWQTELRTKLDSLSLHFAMTCRPGLWHQSDRERIFSFLAALPIAVKQKLRDRRDVSEFKGVLDPRDVDELGKAAEMSQYCCHVLHGYINSMDREDQEVFQGNKCPSVMTVYFLMYNLWAVESAIAECTSLKKFQLSASFTSHLHVVTAFWLALLPLALLETSGLFSFLCLLPVGYSILRLLGIGRELADPFGHDEDDVATDLLSREMRESIQYIYMTTKNGPSSYVKASSFYNRERFHVVPRTPAVQSDSEASQPTFVRSVQSILNNFVSVNPGLEYAVFMWSCVAVIASYSLSFIWDGARRSQCRAWCSPIDVSSDILINVGFALFLILSFRVSSALSRYESGAALLNEIRCNLRSLALMFVQAFSPSKWHEGDKERIVAHLVQVPLALRDEMIGSSDASDEEIKGLLSSEDLNRLKTSPEKIDHLLNVVEAYVLTMDCKDPAYIAKPLNEKTPGIIVGELVGRIQSIRHGIRQAFGVKRFPESVNYAGHQRLFTAVWLALLPLSMTSTMGFFTLLWAPLISYGILGLEAIARQLMDPYGNDSVDLPIKKTADDMISDVLEVVDSVDWDCRHHISASPPDSEPYLGRAVRDGAVLPQHVLPRFGKNNEHANEAEAKDYIHFAGPHDFKEKPTPYAHLLRSVPWSALGFILSASAAGVLLSYFVRRQASGSLLWQSNITVGGAVAGHVSFAAFTLLGFFVKAAFGRYNTAGGIWGDELRASCHALAVQWTSLFPKGTWHASDHERALSHIAALPLAFKADLRGKRDLRELKGLLSQRDLGRLQVAPIMSQGCVDVLRSYLIAALGRKELLSRAEDVHGGVKVSAVIQEISNLELVVRNGVFLASFRVSSAFVALLRTMLWIWFALLPFVLAELTGWLTLIWIPLIAYGLLGYVHEHSSPLRIEVLRMYAIAEELLQPFGTDLNDLDLDRLADDVVADVLYVGNNYHDGVGKLLPYGESTAMAPYEQISSNYRRQPNRQGRLSNISEFWRLLFHVIPLGQVAVLAMWASACVLCTLVVKRLPASSVAAKCLSAVLSMDPTVKGYVGFALFLLLAFRLFDSHSRYTKGQQLWHDGILLYTRMLANRIFQAYVPGTWHKGDLGRIASFLSAIAVTTAARLRDEDCREKLATFMSAADVQAIMEAPRKADYCLDVVRAYLIKGDELERKDPKSHSASATEHFIVFGFLGKLRKQVSECERLVRIPIPFGYVQHSKVFLSIWLALLPLGIAEVYGWLTVPVVIVLAYGVLGIEKWAEELSDPFGNDISDLPLEMLCADVRDTVQSNLSLLVEGTTAVIKPERKAFPSL